MTTMTVKTPWHLWVVGGLALLFNAIGPYDYVRTMLEGSAYLASAGMTPAQIAHYEALPVWVHAAWAIGVWAAIAGAVLLLLRRKLALPVFAVSLGAFMLNMLHTYGLSDGGRIMGQQMAVTNVMIAVILVGLIGYCWMMSGKRVLR